MKLEHGMNCGHYDPEIGCTCCLLERQRIVELEGQVQKLLGEISALRIERDELAKWKSLQQQALASMAMALQDAGYKGDGVVGGIKWLVAERDELVNLLVEWHQAHETLAICETHCRLASKATELAKARKVGVQ